MSTSDRVVVSTRVDVDPGVAFEVFTQEIGEWWSFARGLGTGEVGRCRLEIESGAGGRVREIGQGQAFDVGTVLRWQPGRLLTFEWRQGNFDPDQVTEVEVRFEPRDGGTHVTLTHRGFDTLPVDHSTRHGFGKGPRFVKMFEDFWNSRLAEFVGRASNGAEERP